MFDVIKHQYKIDLLNTWQLLFAVAVVGVNKFSILFCYYYSNDFLGDMLDVRNVTT